MYNSCALENANNSSNADAVSRNPIHCKKDGLQGRDIREERLSTRPKEDI
jgi:hypothetical protein